LFVAFAKPVRWIPKRIVLAVCVVAFLSGFLRVETRSPSDWVVNNFIEVNISGGVGRDYSREFKQVILLEKNHFIPPFIRINSKKETRNIIILVVEGLSNWQSKAVSGLADITPHVDRIVSENVVFKNFYANGYTTEGGLIALFSGEIPIPPPWQVSESAKFQGFGDGLTVPGLLKSSGYWTEFLTTGDLSFTDKNSWLLKIGFNHIEGHDSPFYDGLKRIHFNAASDKALYDRVLTRLQELEGRKYCLVVETVSSHQPFTDPFTGELAPIEVPLRYTDEMVGFFYDALKSQGFFDNGLLFIVGDHRSMTPLRLGEYKLYGESSTARVPLILADGGRSGQRVIAKAFQQTDLLPSLMSAFSGVRINSPFYGDFLTEPFRSPRYILHTRGDDRSLVSVFGHNAQATIKLKGDRTGIIAGEVDDAEFVVTKINYDRITRGKRLD
jgi:lipoteichoic acid synthase